MLFRSRVYKVAELLDIDSKDVLALLKRGDILTHPFTPPSPRMPNMFGGKPGPILPQILELKERGILTDAADTAPYAQDWRKLYQGATRAVVRPANTEELAAGLGMLPGVLTSDSELIGELLARAYGSSLRSDGRDLEHALERAAREHAKLGLAQRGDHDNGDVLGLGVGFQAAAAFVAVHARHHDVQQDQIGLPCDRVAQSFAPSLALATW